MSIHPHILILGGTAEGRHVAVQLAALEKLQLTYSVLHNTPSTDSIPCRIRTGGFGATDGLIHWLGSHAVRAVIDATHPFATTITAHARTAAHHCHVPYIRLRREAWVPPSQLDYRRLRSWKDAARACLALDKTETLLLSIGRRGLASLIQALGDKTPACRVIVRLMHPIDVPSWVGETILMSPPYETTAEQALFMGHHISVLLSKDSGGAMTAAKLEAAATCGIKVLLLARPPEYEYQHKDENERTADSVTALVACLRQFSLI